MIFVLLMTFASFRLAQRVPVVTGVALYELFL